MADISLRAYIDYVEDRLTRDAFVEVVTQARHILESYPKHIDTYRVLAKAIAAQENYTDALDLFQRVLSADPSDFVAHIGMSDCYREDGAIDQAIWHLERAFEQVPSNTDIQAEIRKLYEQRDGRAPSKIQMTSGALARMFVKGKLYDQAVSELTKGLAHDPERLDLQVLLAEALWNSHQEVAAGRVAAEVLKKLPYSLHANRLLAKLWLKAGQPGEARPFIERVKELDPYIGYELEHNGELAPSDSFRLTPVEFTSESHAAQIGAADWVADIKGIEKQKGVTGPLVEGSQITDIFAATAAAAPQPSPISGAPPANAPTPDWLQDALGLKGPVVDPTSASTEGGTEPDWLKDALGGAAPATPPPSGGTPEWLQDVLQDAPPAPSAAKPMPTPSAGDNAPDWLKDALQDTPATPAPASATPPTGGSQNAPDWLKDVLVEQTPASIAPSGSQERQKPAWLDDVLADGTPAPAAPAAPGGPSVVTTDMLNKILGEGTSLLPEEPGGAPAPQSGPGDFKLDELGDLETWDTPAPESVTPPPADWLTKDTGIGTPQLHKEEPEEDKPLPDWLTSAPPPAPSAPQPEASEPESEEAMPDWLSVETPAAAPKAAQPEPEQSAAAEEELPDWLKDNVTPADAPEAVQSKPEGSEEAREELPDWLEDKATPAVAPEAVQSKPEGSEEAKEELPDWLEDKAAPAAALEEETEVAPLDQPTGDNASEEEVPDWLSSGDLDSDDALKWLEEIAAKVDPNFKPEGAAETAPATEAPAPAQAEAAELAEEAPEPARAEAAAPPPAPAEPVPAAKVEEEAEELPAWLKPEAAAEPAKAEAEAPDLEWLRPPTEATAAPEEEVEEVPDWLKPEAEAPVAKAEAAPTDDALSWLDKEIAGQGISPDKPVSEALTPDHPPVAAPMPVPSLDAEAAPASDDELPDWLRGEEVKDEISRALDAPVADADMAELPELPVEADELAWLNEALKAEEKSAGVDDLEELFAEVKAASAAHPVEAEEAEKVAEMPAAKQEEVDELPDWLKGEETPLSALETSGESKDEDLPAWLKGEEAAAPVKPEPAVEAPKLEQKGDELPDWLGAPSEPAPAGTGSLADFLKAVEPAPAASAPSPEPAAPPPPAPIEAAPPPPPMPAAAPAPSAPPPARVTIPAGEADTQLAAARTEMSNGELQAALSVYESLVGSGHKHSDVLNDLTELTKSRVIVNPKIYRVMGDALMGLGRTQEAMDMFRKALDSF